MWIRPLTHTVTHAPKRPERKAGQEVYASCPAFLSGLYDLVHEVSHGLGGFVLLLPCCVGIGAQSKDSVEVPKHGGDSFHVHAVLQGGGGEGVPEIVESEMLQSSVFQDFFVEIHHDVRVVHLSGQGRGEQIWIVWMVVMFQDQQIHRCLRDGH